MLGRRLAVVAVALSGALLAGCSGADDGAGGRPGSGSSTPTTTASGDGGGSTTAAGDPTSVRLVDQRLDLDAPIDLAAVPGTDSELVAERAGRVRLATRRDGRLQLRDEPVLDITDRVAEPSGERGLLGIAVAPDASQLVVHYSERDDGDTRVDSFRLTGSGQDLVADPGSRRQLLAVAQPYPNHNGGTVTFGPDRMLYVGLGDGGAGGDPEGRAQDPGTVLGKLLRLDPSGVADSDGDGIPDDNPFTEGGARPEVWALGLRNPWRFSFDPATGDLWVGDVGQDRWEEVDVVPPEGGAPAAAGANFGWDLYEGTSTFADPNPSPDVGTDGPFVEPVLTYPHEDGACSVTGGVVVRDPDLPALDGWYLYGDYCRPGVRALGPAPADGGRPRLDLLDTGAGVVSFGTGPDRAVYVITSDGTVSRLAPA